MKSSSTGIGKKIAGIALLGVLVVGSLGIASAFAANASDVVPKDTVISASTIPFPTESAAAAQGTIQYSTDAYSRTDGSQNVTFTRWFNPETKDMRSDLKEYDSAQQVTRYQSTYFLNSSELIIIQRDVNSGNPLSGTISKREDQPTIFQKLEGNRGFDTVKASFTSSRWTSVGTEQTSDGKTLNKISAEYQSYITDTTQANMQLIEFLDQATGLPVKEELYEDSTGQYKLFSSNTYEYKYITDDGTIFKPDSITLTPYQAPTSSSGK